MSEQISSHVRDIQRGAESVLSLLKEGKKDENKVLEEIAKAQSGVKELQSCVGASHLTLTLATVHRLKSFD